MNISQEVFSILKLLIPGFLCIKIIETFSPKQEKKEYQLIIDALIYTTIVNAFVKLIQQLSFLIGRFKSFGEWNPDCELPIALIISIILGIIIAHWVSFDTIHNYLREKNLTQVSAISDWNGIFTDYSDCYIQLSLSSGNEIIGHPIVRPTGDKEGYFVLEKAAWIQEDTTEIELENELVFINLSDVNLIRILEATTTDEEQK